MVELSDGLMNINVRDREFLIGNKKLSFASSQRNRMCGRLREHGWTSWLWGEFFLEKEGK